MHRPPRCSNRLVVCVRLVFVVAISALEGHLLLRMQEDEEGGQGGKSRHREDNAQMEGVELQMALLAGIHPKCTCPVRCARTTCPTNRRVNSCKYRFRFFKLSQPFTR